ncbi:MAG: hydantoinase B/oxoprolinase family protein, partial [Planctomycetota bacterium]
RLDADWGTLSGNFERFRYAPYGLNGGDPGSLGRFQLLRDNKVTALPSKISGVDLKHGDRVRLETSGGGGWGKSEDRDPDLQAADIKGGYVRS